VPARRNRRPIDICLLDLSATLLECERRARTIEHRLTLVQRGVAPPLAPEHQIADQIIATSFSLVDEAQKLVQHTNACRALLDKLESELNWLLRG
jgi:hypothetical protein